MLDDLVVPRIGEEGWSSETRQDSGAATLSVKVMQWCNDREETELEILGIEDLDGRANVVNEREPIWRVSQAMRARALVNKTIWSVRLTVVFGE
jgi:hypothetical protein